MYTLKRYDWTLHLATIAVCSYFLAQTVTTYIGGILESLPEGTELKGGAGIRPLAAPAGEEQAPELDSYQLIAERNMPVSWSMAKENDGEEAVPGWA